MGSLEARVWDWDPAKDVVFATLERDDDLDGLLTRQRKNLNLDSRHDVFIFVHGYANTFESACRRTAQMWTDLKFSGLPVMYSWPSAGELRKFEEDLKTTNEWTLKQFARFLSIVVVRFAGNRVHIVTHSMGSRPVMEGLASLAVSATAGAKPPFDQVVLFAPEIPSGRFQELAPLARKMARRISLYGSREDTALRTVKLFYSDVPRAGDLQSSPTGIEGIDMIDATPINYSLSGHTYYADNRSVILDLAEVLAGKPADARPNVQATKPPGHFEFRP